LIATHAWSVFSTSIAASLDVGGLAVFNAAAKPYESVAGAPWLRRVFKNGVESVETFKRIDAGNNRFRYRWVESTPEELETGLFSKTHAEWVAASGGEVPFVRGEDAA